MPKITEYDVATVATGGALLGAQSGRTKQFPVNLFYSADNQQAVAFNELTDVPANYDNQAGKVVVVADTEDGLVFDDAPTSLPAGGTAGQVLSKVSSTDGDATWADSAGGTTIPEGTTAPENPEVGDLWIDLSDPTQYGMFAPSNLVEKKVLTADSASVVFTGLHSLTDGDYLLAVNAIANTLEADLYLCVNGDTTAANYRSKYLGSNVTNAAINSTDTSPAVTRLAANYQSTAFIRICVVNGVFFAVSDLVTQVGTTTMEVGKRHVLYSSAITSINSLTVISADSSVCIKAGSTFSLYKQNISRLLIDSTIKDLNALSSDYLLKVGETAKRTFTGATSVPLRIKCEEGIYDVTFQGDHTVTIGTASSIFLQPNNTTVTAGTIDEIQMYKQGSINSSDSSSPSGAGNGNTNTAFQIGYALLLSGTYKISTYLKSKNVRCDYVRRDSSTVYTYFNSMMYWLDSATVWSSLGTITFPFAQTGTIIIRRIA